MRVVAATVIGVVSISVLAASAQPGPEFVRLWGEIGTDPGEFLAPDGACADASGSILVADSGNHHIQKFSPSGDLLACWGSLGSGNGQFHSPRDVSVGPTGEVYVADTGNRRVEVFAADGSYLRQWPTQGAPQAVDATGAMDEVYVAGGSTLEKYTRNGLQQWVLTAADIPWWTEPWNPSDVAVCGRDSILVQTTTELFLLWGPPLWGNGHRELSVGAYTDHGSRVTVDHTNTAFITDPASSRVFQLPLWDWSYSALWSWGAAGTEPGQLNGPAGIVTTGNGEVFVVDRGNYRVQRFRYGPLISSIADVGSDQGRRVRVAFGASPLDVIGAAPAITQYEVYRRIGVGAEMTLRDGELVVGLRLAGWDYVCTVPAHGEAEYNVLAETLADSTIVGGMAWSAFMIRAASAVPTMFYDSATDSGYSVDNLAPGVPGNPVLRAQVLSWDEASDADFDYFTVYGSEAGNIRDAIAIERTVEPELNVAGYTFSWFLITATDFSGNEGGAAVVQNGATAAPLEARARAYRFYGARPNPSVREVALEFEMPETEQVRLTIHDVGGGLVRALVDREVVAGRHDVSWDGRDQSGRSVCPGIYFARLRSGTFTATERIVRVR